MRTINISRIHNQSNENCSWIPSAFALSPYHREKLHRLGQFPVRLIALQCGINARQLLALEANHSRTLSSLRGRTASVKAWNVASPTITVWIAPYKRRGRGRKQYGSMQSSHGKTGDIAIASVNQWLRT